MSKLGMGVTSASGLTLYTVDMRDEIITNIDQLLIAIDQFRKDHVQQIGLILLSPTQEYCLRAQYRPEEGGTLKRCMGFAIYVSTE